MQRERGHERVASAEEVVGEVGEQPDARYNAGEQQSPQTPQHHIRIECTQRRHGIHQDQAILPRFFLARSADSVRF